MLEISKKMLTVMHQCATIAKNGVNSFHRYKYAMAADVAEKVNAALVEAGVAIYCNPEVYETSIVMTKDGKQENLVTVKMVIDLIDSETGEKAQISGLGAGQDAGDKAIMKAQTAALKYAWMSSLVMAAGDDPEADDDGDRRREGNGEQGKNRSGQKFQDKNRQGASLKVPSGDEKSGNKKPLTSDLHPPVVTLEQVQQLQKLMHETQTNEVKFLQYLQVETLAHLPADRFEWAQKALEAKKKATAKDNPNLVIAALSARNIPYKVDEQAGEIHATPSFQDTGAKAFLKEQGFKWNPTGKAWIKQAA